MVATHEFMTLPEIRRAGLRNVPREVWDYVSGGAETETTLRRNRRAMSNFVFRPRVLRDVSHIDLSTTVLGLPLALPIMIAPMGSLCLLHPDGDVAMARAAGRLGTIHWLSTMTASSPEEVSAAANGPLMFQLYFRGSNEWCESILRRVEAAGFRAIALTVDSANYGRRERDIERRLDFRDHPRGLDVPMERGRRQATLTWRDVEWLQQATTLPIVVKGIQSPEDARLAVEHGVKAIWVSNHGGRQMDHADATIEVLPEIVAAVDGRAEVLVDGGFQRGTDVLKALAMGARAVCIGKAAAWGLAAAGEEGVARTLELFDLELRIAMANTGQRGLSEVGPDLVRRACHCD
jgi:isopentenyl diphosphate isomerase/L-lactate dehydrogenase-like FMN-dependent dehydrogenase